LPILLRLVFKLSGTNLLYLQVNLLVYNTSTLSSLLIVDLITKDTRLYKISWCNYEGVNKVNIEDLSKDNSDNWIDLSRIIISKVLRL
jgi:hypothetical protein